MLVEPSAQKLRPLRQALKPFQKLAERLTLGLLLLAQSAASLLKRVARWPQKLLRSVTKTFVPIGTLVEPFLPGQQARRAQEIQSQVQAEQSRRLRQQQAELAIQKCPLSQACSLTPHSSALEQLPRLWE